MDVIHLFDAALFAVAMAYAAVADFRSLEIPNWVPATVAVSFVPAAWISGVSLEAAGWHVGTGVVVFVIGAVLFGFGVMGGGDVKLLAAAAVWMGADDIGIYLFYVAVAGGLLALLVIGARPLGTLQRRIPWLTKNPDGKQRIPYGIAIAAGVLPVLPHMDLLPTSVRGLAGG